MRGMSSAWLGSFTRQLTEESRLGRPGADTVLTRLAELMFIEVLRRYLEDLPPGQTGWLAGLRDEVVGRVVGAAPWPARSPLDARRAGARSRLVPLQRGQAVRRAGRPAADAVPAQWRMQVAANLLAQSGAKVATIGAEVGYDSEAAFSRAFKKATGLAPGAWREARRTAARSPSPRPDRDDRAVRWTLDSESRSRVRPSRKSGRPVIGGIAPPWHTDAHAPRGRAQTH